MKSGILRLIGTTLALSSFVPMAHAQQHSGTDKEAESGSLPAYPAGSPEPIERTASVRFISNGYWLETEHCQLVESSGDPEADEQACSTVQFYKTPKGKVGTAATKVWSRLPIEGTYMRPRKTNKTAPVGPDDYPASSLRRGEQGTVTMRLLVNTAGKVTGCTIMISSGSSELDETACRTFSRKARYQPATLNGAPIDSYVFEPVRFYLGNGPQGSD
ncbi:energy transducer TonB [Blastomonas sp. SL216]|uniref:energy transducer TonB n=1 Tax=Blastomonas sp. SL216 TaxID=2995169 RepID=UPI002376D7FD|nr:energy transducer TonB [Blastomonas sp. SL216]